MVTAVIITADHLSAKAQFQMISGVATLNSGFKHIFKKNHNGPEVTVTVTGNKTELANTYDFVVIAGTDEVLSRMASTIQASLANKKNIILLKPENERNEEGKKAAEKAFKQFTPTTVYSKDELFNTLSPAPVKVDTSTNISNDPLANNNKRTNFMPNMSMNVGNLFGKRKDDTTPKTPTAWDRILTVLGINKKSLIPGMDKAVEDLVNEAAPMVEKLVEEKTLFQQMMARLKTALNITDETNPAEAVEDLVSEHKDLFDENKRLKEENLRLNQEYGTLAQTKALAEQTNTTLREELEQTKTKIRQQDKPPVVASPQILLDQLKLDWKNEEYLKFWEAQTFGGGTRLEVNNKVYRLPNRIANLITKLQNHKNLSENNVKEEIQNIRSNKTLSSTFGWMGRSSVTKQFYSARPIEDNTSSLQNYMGTAYTQWERKSKRCT